MRSDFDLSMDPYVSIEVLERLSKHKNIGILRGLLKNPKTTTEILERIINNSHYEQNYSMIIDIIQNPKLSESMLFKVLSLNINKIYKREIYDLIKNPKITTEFLKSLLPFASTFHQSLIINHIAELKGLSSFK